MALLMLLWELLFCSILPPSQWRDFLMRLQAHDSRHEWDSSLCVLEKHVGTLRSIQWRAYLRPSMAEV